MLDQSIRHRDFGIPDLEFRILGEGNFGDKAGRYWKDAETLKSIGFRQTPKVVVSDGFWAPYIRELKLGEGIGSVENAMMLEYVLKHNNLPPQFVSWIWGNTTHAFFQSSITGIHKSSFSDDVVAVRSSAKRDSQGTGLYTSSYHFNNPADLDVGLRKVLASFFSETARRFRLNQGISPEFGILIEPLIGQEFGHGYPGHKGQHYFGPLVSGHTTTRFLSGEDSIVLVPGFGSGVDVLYSERLTISELQSAGYKLSELIKKRRKDPRIAHENEYNLFSGQPANYTNDDLLVPMQVLRYDQINNEISLINGIESYCRTREIKTRKESSSWEDILDLLQGRIPYGKEVFKLFEGLNFERFTKQLGELERRLGPQYIEFAITANPNMEVWITQLSDIDSNSASDLKPSEVSNTEYDGIKLVGSSFGAHGIKHYKGFVFSNTIDEFNRAIEFLKSHPEYGLMYDQSIRQGSYNHFSSLTRPFVGLTPGVIELQGENKLPRPVGHVPTLLKHADMHFAILHHEQESHTLENLLPYLIFHKDLPIINKPFIGVADEGYSSDIRRFLLYESS